MTNQSGGGGGAPSGAAGGSLAGTYPNPSLSGVGVPQELGYVQTTTNQTGIGTSFVDLTSLTLTVTVGTRPIMLEAYLSLPTVSSVNNRILLQLIDTTSGSVNLVAVGTAAPGSGTGYVSVVRQRLTPSAGSHSYKVQAAVDIGTMQTNASAVEPAWFQIREV